MSFLGRATDERLAAAAHALEDVRFAFDARRANALCRYEPFLLWPTVPADVTCARGVIEVIEGRFVSDEVRS